VVAHVAEVAIAPIPFPVAQEVQVPLPSARHAVHPVTETAGLAVFLQRTQVREAPVPLAT